MNDRHPLMLSIGNRWEKTGQECPHCFRGFLVVDRMHENNVDRFCPRCNYQEFQKKEETGNEAVPDNYGSSR